MAALLTVGQGQKSLPAHDVIATAMHAYMQEVATYPDSMKPKVVIADQWHIPKESTTIHEWISDEIQLKQDQSRRLKIRRLDGERLPAYQATIKANQVLVERLSKVKEQCGASDGKSDYQTPFPIGALKRSVKVEIDGTTSIDLPVFSGNGHFALVSVNAAHDPYSFAANYLLEKNGQAWKIVASKVTPNHWSWCGLAPTIEDMKREGWKRQRAQMKSKRV